MQQINLYTEELAPKKVLISLAQTLVILAGITLLLIVSSAYLLWQQSQSQSQLNGMKAQALTLQSQADSLIAQAEATKIDDNLKQANQRLREKLIERRRFVDQLGLASENKRSASFSQILAALAAPEFEKLWFTGISIGQAGASLTLSGDTVQPDLVPRYIRALRTQPATSGREFIMFEMTTNDKDQRLSFVLSAEADPQAGGQK